MVHVLKIYVAPQSGLPDIRRLAVSSDVLNSYELLVKKIISVIPKLNGKSFELCWKDDGDDIVVTNDDELAQAIANSEDSVIKVYVRFTGVDAEQQGDTSGEAHVGVMCDSCNQEVKGYRYKCLQCVDFDLCSACNSSGKHPFHDMLKLASPARYSRQWLFVGWKKLFRSAFGFEPMTEMIDYYENGPKCPFMAGQRQHRPSPHTPPHPPPHPPMDVPFKEFMKNNNVNLLENLGQFVTNLLEPLGVDVKVDIDHSRKESSSPKSEKPEKEVPKDSKPSENSDDDSVKSEEQKPKTATAESKCTEELTATATESKCTEEAEVKPTVTKHENVKETTNPSTVTGDSKKEEETRPKSAFEILNAAGSVMFGLGLNGGVRPKSKSSSPTAFGPPPFPTEMSHGLFTRHFDESVVSDGAAEGFTVISSSLLNEADKKNEAEAQPTAPESDEKVQYPVLVEEPVEVDQNTGSGKSQKTTPEYYFSSDIDPQVVNALNKMSAMGFSNEGGWLLRLLQTKKGNINEALDSLYPNPQRH